jgi:hypothetical protein
MTYNKLKGAGLVLLALELLAFFEAWILMDKEPKTSFLTALLVFHTFAAFMTLLVFLVVQGLELWDRR